MTEDVPSSTAEEVNGFSSPWPQSDVVFVVEGRQLHCNKAVLSMVSPVFQAMFESNFKEKTAREVPLPEKKYDDMVAFFRCIHPHVSKDVAEETLEVLLSLADEYQCQVLTRKCRDFLALQLERCHFKRQIKRFDPDTTDISGEAILRWLRLMDQFPLDTGLFEGLLVELTERMEFDDLERCDDYDKLGATSVRLLFRSYMNKRAAKATEQRKRKYSSSTCSECGEQAKFSPNMSDEGREQETERFSSSMSDDSF